MSGYEFQSIGELIRAARMVSLLAGYGMVMAETAEQKQFILERIAIEMGMSITDIRCKFGAKPGEMMDLTKMLNIWEEKEAGNWWAEVGG